MAAPVSSARAGISAEVWVLVLVLSIPWGASFLFYRVLAESLPALTIVLVRLGVAAPILYLLLRLRGQRLRVPWFAFAVMSLLNNVVPFALYAWAETRVTSGVASILNAFTPITTALVLHAFGADRLTRGRVLGVVLGLAGVAVLVGADFWALNRDFLADLACLGSTVCYGFAALWSRRIRHVAPLQAACAQVLCGALLLAPAALLVDRPWLLPMPGLAVWLNLIGLAAFSTAFAYVLYFRILVVGGPANLPLVTFLLPVSTVAMAAVFLAEPVTLRALGGTALIVLGLLAIDGRLWRWARRRRYDPENQS